MIIKRLTLSTPNLAGQMRFYEEILGFIVERSDFLIGDSKLSFYSDTRSVIPAHFAMNVDQDWLDEAPNWLTERGITPILSDESRPFEFTDWHARAVYFLDPDGNILEFISRDRQPRVHESRKIYNISEIGLPVKDVLAERTRIQSLSGIPSFGAQSDQFSPLGDDVGLLILVSEGREWFPNTKVPAQLPNFELQFGNANQSFKASNTSEEGLSVVRTE